MIRRNFLLTLRRIKSREKIVWLNIFSFIVGLSAFMFITLFVYNELTVDTYYQNYNRTYRVLENNNNAGIDYHLNDILRNEYPEITNATAVYQSSEHEFTLKTPSQQFVTKSFISTDNNFFEIFDVKAIKASSKNILATENSLVLTPSTANKLFGNEEALGQKVDFMGKPLTVSAIIPEFPLKSSLHADFIVNIKKEKYRFHRGIRNEKLVNLHNHYIVADRNVDPEKLADKINKNLPSHLTTVEKVSFQSLQSIYLNPEIELSRNRHGNKATLKVLISIAFVILSLSIINNLQFSLSYHFSNIKNIGLQIFNGASKRQIFLHYLSDTFVLLLLVYLISMLSLWIFHPIVNPIFSGGIDLSHIFSWPFLIVLSFSFALIIILGGYIPLYVLSKTDIKNLLSKKTLTRYKPAFKNILPVFQFVIAIVLLICSMTIHKQLSYTKSHHLGFDKQHLLQLIDPAGFNKNDVLKQKMENLSFVKSASWSYGAPAFIQSYYYSEEGGEIIEIGIDDNFLKTFDITLLEGRKFQHGDLEKVCYVNEAFLKSKNWAKPEDYLNQKALDYNIIGLVNDFNSSSLYESIPPTILYFTSDAFFLNLRLSKGNLPGQMSEIKNIWEEVYPDEFFNYKFYDTVFDNMYKREEKLGQAINLFTFIAFFITGMGLLGLVMQMSLSSTKEIGIRKVNGAKISEILTLFNKDFIKWVLIAFVIASPIAWYAMNKWLENFAYKTELSWWVFALAGLIAMGVALLTVSWQSWRAATRNPVEALRYE